MKVLIAITSCVRDAQNGNNQALRDTFLKDVANRPDLEYRFFLGDGTPTGEDETTLRAGVHGAIDNNRGIDYNEKCTESERTTLFPHFTLLLTQHFQRATFAGASVAAFRTSVNASFFGG